MIKIQFLLKIKVNQNHLFQIKFVNNHNNHIYNYNLFKFNKHNNYNKVNHNNNYHLKMHHLNLVFLEN